MILLYLRVLLYMIVTLKIHFILFVFLIHRIIFFNFVAHNKVQKMFKKTLNFYICILEGDFFIIGVTLIELYNHNRSIKSLKNTFKYWYKCMWYFVFISESSFILIPTLEVILFAVIFFTQTLVQFYIIT